jgi:hypothetical protein
MDRRPVISAFVLHPPRGPASQATAAQGATLAAASPVAAGDFSDRILAGGNCIWSVAARAAPPVILDAGAWQPVDWVCCRQLIY